ncbi:replication factor C subunit 1 [Bombus impatiens]|uniref:Replication factor C subunit 1 n=1 Tax=Bombus impatiens TaxID=132113 RepID=A0A6P3ULT5_BOMIM|nr:replication factor C subunit 1 [Bombus impatiens]
MPRDIRSYFQTIKTNSNVAPAKATKKRIIISSDEDEDKSQSPRKRPKKTKLLEKKAIKSDSNEDIKIISPADMFGKNPVNRQEATKISRQSLKQKAAEVPKISKKLQKKEAEGHNDDDFEATLRQLDTSDIEQRYLTEIKVNEDTSLHESSIENKEKTPIKNKEDVKKKTRPDKTNQEKDNKEHEPKNKKHSNNISDEDIKHKGSENSSKFKHTKKSSKTSSAISKMEVEYLKEKNETSPKKIDTSDVYEEKIEKKKQNAAMYQQYLQRGGARNPGSKEIPVGAEQCLTGLSFVITGVLDSLEREEAEELIKQYGGRILHQISKKTDYVIVGDQAGPAKLSKATNLNIKKISEDDLLELIRTRPAGQSDNVTQPRTKSKERSKRKFAESSEESTPKKKKITVNEETKKAAKVHSPHKTESSKREIEDSLKQELYNKDEKIKSSIEKKQNEYKESLVQDKKEIIDVKDIKIQMNSLQDISGNIPVQALVEKYRPKTMKQILGQQGDKSNAKKIHTWLMNWHKNQSGQVKHTRPGPWAKDDNGAFFKAALLSGPPGIGKTTTVQVVCNELGFDLIEFNASDTRSKKLLQEEVSELLSNTTIKNYFKDVKSKPSSKHVLLMDEVDGMAGNEDRGGLQELITLIKSTDIPIVCICNDRNNPKMRTLSNYTFDLRFPKPRLEQIRGAMKSMCFKENIQISNEDLDRLIESTNQDIRQVINHLALFVGQTGSQEKNEKKHINKDLRLGPWDVVKKVFSVEEHKHMSISDKSNLFFHDYNIAPLFVQENYLMVIPQVPKNELLGRVAESAESIALGDVVEKSIRSNNAWSLLPIQAYYSSVIPGTAMSGHIGGQINFPAWLGRNSKTGKLNRLMQEITLHARLATGASKEAINLDYIRPLRNTILRPLAVGGIENVDTAIDVMNHYHLLREDLDSLVEISLWPGDRDPFQIIDSKVKAAFTRAYNKSSVALPYIVSGTSKKKVTSSIQEEGFLEEEEEEIDSDQNDDNLDADKMIKAKKAGINKNTESKGKNTDKTEKKGKNSSDKSNKRGRGRGKAK